MTNALDRRPVPDADPPSQHIPSELALPPACMYASLGHRTPAPPEYAFHDSMFVGGKPIP
ncbi:hypothetical protein [Burkholderia pseudomultivorans]|uniref:hypothetical protein n=1 Tax=Burkholderia pseudomultivorans TaxID=1207504 RepID=UPI0012DB35C6|nr:hypothetical protein [Burkholderia pseudomultivorans]